MTAAIRVTPSTSVAEPARVLLPARSVILSVLLGSHPPTLPVRVLVRTAELFGISEGTARVALSRLSADGEVVADAGTYGLSPRHLERQHDQDRALRPATRVWRGGWVWAMVLPGPGGPAEGAAPGGGFGGPGELRRRFERRRMAEVRPGVWGRPDNLRAPESPRPGSARPGSARSGSARPGDDPPIAWWSGRLGPDGLTPARLVARMWDLEGWAVRAEELMEGLKAVRSPADRLSVAAAMVRHLRADPVLPPALLPPAWPGDRLRRAYDGYRAELGALISGLRQE